MCMWPPILHMRMRRILYAQDLESLAIYTIVAIGPIALCSRACEWKPGYIYIYSGQGRHIDGRAGSEVLFCKLLICEEQRRSIARSHSGHRCHPNGPAPGHPQPIRAAHCTSTRAASVPPRCHRCSAAGHAAHHTAPPPPTATATLPLQATRCTILPCRPHCHCPPTAPAPALPAFDPAATAALPLQATAPYCPATPHCHRCHPQPHPPALAVWGREARATAQLTSLHLIPVQGCRMRPPTAPAAALTAPQAPNTLALTCTHR